MASIPVDEVFVLQLNWWEFLITLLWTGNMRKEWGRKEDVNKIDCSEQDKQCVGGLEKVKYLSKKK